MENAIEIKNLCKQYTTFSLKNVNITLPKGYIMGFIGPNGRGKSTTIGSMLGLVHGDSGSCLINGKPIAEMTKAEREEIGVVLDECCFPETLNLTEVDRFSKHIYKKWDSEKFISMCEKFGLPKKEEISRYSKGMKMKLTIAAALSHGAKTLILDEATSGLDPIVRDDILDMLLDFVQSEEHSVFMSSHITSDLEKVCDYITFIKNGEIVFSFEKDELLEKYGILRCANQDFEKIDKSAVISFNRTSFATDALVYRDKIGEGFIVDKANIEDIMLHYIKGEEI